VIFFFFSFFFFKIKRGVIKTHATDFNTGLCNKRLGKVVLSEPVEI